MLGMHADLVGPAGFDPHFAVRMAALALEHLEVADRLLADRIDLHVALATLAQAHVQRGVHGHRAIGHAAGQQRQVALADAGAVVFSQQRLQLAQGRALLGHDQQAGGIPVQAMDQLQGLARPQCAQGFDGAETDAAAAVTGHARRLVQRQQPIVFEHDGIFQPLHERGRRASLVALFVETDGRHPDFVAALQLALGLGAAAIDADLATSHELVDQAARCTLELAEQEVVQALPGTVGRNSDDTYAGHGFSGFGGGLGNGHWPFILLHSAGEIRD